QHPRDRGGDRRAADRRRRELAAPLPRHGAHRLLAVLSVPGDPHRDHAAPRVPLPPRALAVDDPRAAGPALPRPGPRLPAFRAAPAAEEDAGALRFPSVGSPVPGHEVRILGEAGADLAEGDVGRLVFRGPSMMEGYFRQPQATAAIRVEGGWLDSGDLAFLAD